MSRTSAAPVVIQSPCTSPRINRSKTDCCPELKRIIRCISEYKTLRGFVFFLKKWLILAACRQMRRCVSEGMCFKKKNDKTDRSVCCCGTSGHGRPEELDFSPRKLSAFDVTQWPHTRRSSGVRTNRNPSDAANPKRSYFSVGLLRAPLTAWIKAHNASIQKTDTSVGITEADEKKKKKKKTKQLINCFFFSFLFNKLKCWVTFKHLAETR